MQPPAIGLRQRIEDRQRSLRRSTLVAARLTVDDAVHDCAILNVSDSGARIRLEGPAAVVAGRAALGLGEHAEVPAELVWQDGTLVGLEFGGEAKTIKAFIDALDSADRSPLEARRHQRCSVLWPVQVFSGGRLNDGLVLNLSASGVKVKLSSSAMLGDRVTLSCDRFGDLPARLVWRSDHQFGAEFLDPPHKIAALLGPTLPRIRDCVAGPDTTD